MKKWANQKRKFDKFKVSDLVLVKLKEEKLKYLRRVHQGIVRKYERSFPIIARVNKVSYKV